MNTPRERKPKDEPTVTLPREAMALLNQYITELQQGQALALASVCRAVGQVVGRSQLAAEIERELIVACAGLGTKAETQRTALLAAKNALSAG